MEYLTYGKDNYPEVKIKKFITIISCRFLNDPTEPRYCDVGHVCCSLSHSDEEFGQQDEPPMLMAPPPPSTLNHRGCGYQNEKLIKPRRYGEKLAENAENAEFPWMVAVLTTRGKHARTFEYRCGGSLIHPSVVMTAAHCVDDVVRDNLKVRAGEWDTRNTNEPWPHQDRDVREILKHGDYYKQAVHNDMALLFLDAPMRLAPNVNTVCLPVQNARFDGKRCLVSGWGKDMFGRKGQFQQVLKKIELPIVEHRRCERLLRETKLGRYFRLHRSFMCAGGERGTDACKGDGGSPLVCGGGGSGNIVNDSPNRYYQAGIVSWGVGCKEPKVPAAYVNVAAFRHWIDRQMASHKLDTHYYRN